MAKGEKGGISRGAETEAKTPPSSSVAADDDDIGDVETIEDASSTTTRELGAEAGTSSALTSELGAVEEDDSATPTTLGEDDAEDAVARFGKDPNRALPPTFVSESG